MMMISSVVDLNLHTKQTSQLPAPMLGNIDPDFISFIHSYMNTGQGDNDMGSAPPL